MKFALCFGNRSFMPGELVLEARTEMAQALSDQGYKFLMMDESATRFGAVETRDEGRLYAQWLKENKAEIDGVIFSMPIFADENGAAEALREAGVPILLQAYPDAIGKMDPANRRDAYCGKFSVANVLMQCGVPFTVFKPHVAHPFSSEFTDNLKNFAAVCRVVKGMKRFTVGNIGARTTAFKTTRYDEITLENYGITVESIDLSVLINKVQNLRDDLPQVVQKKERLQAYSDCSCVPAVKMDILAKVGVVLDELISQYHLDAISLRCWDELESILRICPCVLLSELNNRNIAASCEVDVCSAVMMRAMTLASGQPAAVMDWNNNYGDDPDKVVLFHCGPVAQSLMAEKGTVTEHKLFAACDPGSGWGTNEGRLRPMPMTYANCQTRDGKLLFYCSEGILTNDPIEEEYFGCAGVARIEHLQDILLGLMRRGFKHHTAIGSGYMQTVLLEAFGTYLNYEKEAIDH